jgi:hypothetical protein
MQRQMKCNRYHIGGTFAPFIVQNIERTCDVVVKVCWGAETIWEAEFAVAAV